MRGTIPCLLLATTSLSAQTGSPPSPSVLQGGILTLVQDFGRAQYSTCRLTLFYGQPPMPGTDRVELRCTPNVSPRVDDVHASRNLSLAEVAAIVGLVIDSDLYSGGHVGNYGVGGNEGLWERLEVERCCGRVESVVLITDGNSTFSTGSRRDLLNLLSKWRANLIPTLSQPKVR
jgi:hypothetical protein